VIVKNESERSEVHLREWSLEWRDSAGDRGRGMKGEERA